ncbi:MAG: tRNA (cytosine(32)/uridine(32)-2'-O)-methyltransferase TrmJ [Pseudomonadales bacterium]
MLANIRVVLVNTDHPGNIGGAARALKNMGLTEFYLVDPKEYPSERARWRAAGAQDVLDGAIVVPELKDAIADCGLVFGTSARQRTIPWTVLDVREAALKAVESSVNNKVALVFGREDRGLTNEELQQCQIHLSIPSDEEYGVLNVAAAVQVVCYELRMAALAEIEQESKEQWDIEYATAEDVERLYQHMEKVMTEVGFYDPNIPKQLSTRVRRLLGRSRMDRMEVNILRGFMAAVERKMPD